MLKKQVIFGQVVFLCAHMNNPFVPAAHMNTRFLVTGLGENRKFWFGGGVILPNVPDKKSAIFFHKNLNLCAINMIRNIIKSIKNGVMIIFSSP